MKKVKFSGVKSVLRSKGYLITLLLCFSAVGVSTYIAYSQTMSNIGKESGVGTSQDVLMFPGTKEEDALPVEKDKENIPKTENKPSTTPPPEAANSFILPKNRVLPIKNGEIIGTFSNGELVRSKTLNLWKTHDGIDIKAEIGTEVLAMSEGKVAQIYDDPLWGICVVIDHQEGVFGHYYNLSPDVLVKAEESVSSGQIIGTVGNTAGVESLIEPHLHFGLKQNDVYIDPLKYIEAS